METERHELSIAQGPDEIDEIFARAIEEDDAERERLEGIRIARRLVVAFILVMATGAICWVVLPRFGMSLPPAAVLALFGVMAFASLAPLFENRKPAATPPEPDTSRPISCCGLRPVGEASRKRAERRDCSGGSCGCS